MERSRKHKTRKDNKGRKSPKVPIKTYRWEDIRRARRRGGYPWTHLYKPPFNETVDPEQYTMEALRRSKSASTMGAKSEGVEISEVTSYAESGKTTPSFLTTEMVTEPHEDISAKNSRPGSVVIEEYVEDEDKHFEDDLQVKEFHMESAESSDNISQYLDKEERGPSNSKTKKDKNVENNEEDLELAKLEASQKKRKLSAESGHSRYSITKLGVIKKLREAKTKIKVPKIAFSTKKNSRNSPPKESKKEEKKSKKEAKKEAKKGAEVVKSKVVKPTYIHIPLKSPPDELSDLESEKKTENGTSVDEKGTEDKADETESTIKPLQDQGKSDKVEDDKENLPFKALERGPKVTRKPPLQINPAFKQLLKDVKKLKEKELQESATGDIKKTSEVQKVASQEQEKVDLGQIRDEVDSKVIKKPDVASTEAPATPKPNLDEEEPMDLEEQQTSDAETPKEDPFDKLFQVSVQKPSKTNKDENEKDESSTSRNIRSKSAEPQRKRRSSIESSYSRKSLSKLGILKKLKEASEKIKGAFSMSSLKKKDTKKDEKEEKPKKDEDKEHKQKKPKPTSGVKGAQLNKNVEPVYIHIPLKPPEGQTDEFSYLEFEHEETNKTEPTKPIKEERTDSLDSTSPVSPKNNDIQFIFLTPPSDDEILDDKAPELPDTPSSEDMVFFGSLKKLAMKVVDEVSPETKGRGLETVSEENGNDKGSNGDLETSESKPDEKDEKEENSGVEINEEPVLIEEKPQEPEKPEDSQIVERHEQMIVDEEDGLNEPPKSDELKSALKSPDTSSPVLKKKVSFKKKSKPTIEKTKDESGYEPVGIPKEETPAIVSEVAKDNEESTVKDKIKEEKKGILGGENNQSMSVDEEKTYLDQKIVKDTSLEEDYNKWSKSSDHEYELINPPDEVEVMTASVPPSVTVIDTNHEAKVVISATEILQKPVEEKKKPFFHFRKQHKEKIDSNHGGSIEGQSGSSQGDEPVLEISDQSKTNEGPNKFQAALKQTTDQLKNKTNEFRKKMRNINMPKASEFKKPDFKKPQFKKPDFKKFKIEKPKINLNFPKIPDTTTIHLPNFGLTGAKKTIEKRTIETRQFSTESNAGDIENQKRSKFDFNFGGTFPRFRKKKNKENQDVVFATVPRTKKNKDEEGTNESGASSVRVHLHSEDSEEDLDAENVPPRTSYEDREMSEDIERTSRTRFNKDIAIDDDYERENQEINHAEYLNRWQHGNFSSRGENNDDRYEEKDNEDEQIIGQLIEERFKRVGLGYGKGKLSENLFQTHLDPPLEERYEHDESETLEERLRRDEDQPTYMDDDDEDDYNERFQQNKEIITDLDNLEEEENGHIKDGYSSEGSNSFNRRGRLGKLDVNSDEFFVVHEIREGFHTPANALAQMNEYDPIGSNRSLPQVTEKRRPIKKPKRKKTPHVSQEEIQGDEESFDGAPPPSRPKRRSKKGKRREDNEDIIVPYQETIPLDVGLHGQRLDFPRESLGILGDDEQEEQDLETFDDEKIQATKQFPTPITDPYKKYQIKDRNISELEKEIEPSAPPRKHKSLKSLTSASENESILTDGKYDDKNINSENIEDYIIPAHKVHAPPQRPSRRSRSHTSSLSRVSLPPSQRDTDSILTDENYLAENQPIPSYLIENQFYKQQNLENQEVPDYLDENQPLKPCVEEPCIQDIRDYMGYAIVDKNKPPREPPLPPPRTPPRRHKRQIEPDEKFATVPRHVGSSQANTPTRPLRNYSTIGHSRNKKEKENIYENDKENKENEGSIGQYIEVNDNVNRDLVSGEIVQKMQQRPLPAPPRPPRKPRTLRKSLQDITSKENIMSSSTSPQDLKTSYIQEETVYTQTEPLPDDFVCEEILQDPTDTIIIPRINASDTKQQNRETQPPIRRELITPSVYSYEETVTHGTLLVEPLNGTKILPDNQMSKEHFVPINRDYSDGETSEIPENFKKLKSPTDVETQKPIEVLKTEKLEVSDLDVDRLRVNQLLASKIIVSEIDSSTIHTDELQGKSGPLRVGEIELPPRLLEEIVRQLESRSSGQSEADQRLQGTIDNVQEVEKKTPIFEESIRLKEPQQVPLVETSVSPQGPLENFQHLENQVSTVDSTSDVRERELSLEPPLPPPRSYTLEETPPDAPPRTLRRQKDSSKTPEDSQPEMDANLDIDDSLPPRSVLTEMLEPEVDDQPPPRPPEPAEGLYFPSQPPASFYALRAKQYVEGLDNENIPTAPRRKRHQRNRSRPVSRSRSTSDESSVTPSHPHTRSPRHTRRFSDPSIPELTGRLIQACGNRVNNTLKRLIYHLTENILRNADGQQDLHVLMIILLVLIAGLILLGYGEERTVVHLHHWEYFNPPKDI